MAQKKLQRFADIKTFPNVLEYPKEMAGNWGVFFKNTNPITLELACGRGEYTIGMAALYPQRNFIGIDIKGNRMYIGAKQCLAEKITNAAFLRTQIEKLPDYFTAGEVNEIWITFPDPQLRVSKAKKRLTHPRFLRLYNQVLTTGGTVNLKTDSPDLYHFTKIVLTACACPVLIDNPDVYAKLEVPPALCIKTHYENLDIAQSKKIHYLSFTLPTQIKNIDKELHQQLKNDSNNTTI